MPRRLIIRPGAIGDFILTLPAMECLRTEYLEVWSASRNLPLVRFADQTRSIAATGLDMLEFTPQPRLTEELRTFDSIVSWYGANRPEFRSLIAGLGLPFHFFPALPPEDSPVHAADFYMEQARTLVPCDARCDAPAIPRIKCERREGNFAVIHPFAGSPRKCWPLEGYLELARRLEKRMPVRWCAGPEERLQGAVRIDNLYDLARWLATARLYIGNDSGITHLAAAVETPVLALFGPTNPSIWAPRGPHVRVASL